MDSAALRCFAGLACVRFNYGYGMLVAKDLILIGDKQAALQVNRAVKVLGNSLDFITLRNQIYDDFPTAKRKLLFYSVKYDPYESDDTSMKLLDSLGIKIKTGFFMVDDYEIQFQGTTHSASSLSKWILENLSVHPDFQGI
jgi:hypothetical protein